MGKRSRGVHDAAVLSQKAGGSDDTKKHRRLHWQEFSRFAQKLGHTLGAVHEAEDWMIEFFIWFMVAGATDPGTLGNYRAALSTLHAAAGQDMTDATKSRTLQLEKRDRRGKHRSRTREEFIALVAEALLLNEGVAHVIQLMRWLGLRMREALMSGRSLETWRDMIVSGNRRLPVERGAKNKRARRTEVLEGHVNETLAAIEAALEFCRHRNYELITGCRSDLKSAKSRLKAFFDRLPMRRELASHSLRYTYAVEFAIAELAKGTPPVDVLMKLSDRLGHGPSRVNMILNVYCWEIRHLFPEKIKLPSDFVPRDKRKNKKAVKPHAHSPFGKFQRNSKPTRRRCPARTHRVNNESQVAHPGHGSS